MTSFNQVDARAGNLLICSLLNAHSLIHSTLICSFAHLLNLLKLLKTNERLWANPLGRSRQMSNHERFTQVAHDKWVNEWFGQIAQVTHQKWVNMCDSLRSLTKNKRPWVNRSGPSTNMSERANRSFFWANCSFAHLLPKMSDSLRKLMSEIPALVDAPLSRSTLIITSKCQKWLLLFLEHNDLKIY